ncbi:PREDICTED: protein asteroid-like [Dinoponera quadriceps]|uniref:Protein asteroid-like n=1 Tax=Dinoponera quadriceps TaxID=609295 RepID=A0A6P3WSH0_DINQU|nr:PREDICTED: protein asteroid-like [Dinoponera quadriceps]
MGIPGLTTFIANYSERYLVNYELHDTYLVIDGNSIACQLYNWYANCNCAFGGDYDKYAQCVLEFFDELSKCNVTPLVLFDGGSEDKKLKTIITRAREKIRLASYYTPSSQHRNKFFPLCIKEVFKDVMKEKGIRYVQCIFEADNTIAAVARILRCPVLSYDSDFYIYGSLYIPFSTWRNYIVRNSAGNGYVKRCKIYCVENLFHSYNGLNQSLLPLAAVLLGNDYVKQHTFRNFFRHLKLPPAGRRKYNEQQRRIDATFDWLRRNSLNQAIIGILSRLRKEKRQQVLKIIETIINSYINASLSVLALLGVPAEKFSRVHMHGASKTYKFEGDIYKLMYIEEKTNETELSEEEEVDEQEATSILQETELVSNESLVNNLPEWFINEFKMGMYPSYFIDLIIRKLYIFPAQVEDYYYASSAIASLKIINAIYGLLISGMDGEKSNMKYMTRDENKRIRHYCLEYNDNIFDCKLPALSNLRDVPIAIRKEMLNTTLGVIGENCMNEIPSAWMLYVATMKHWIDQQQEPAKLNYHVYSLLFAMLFNIIDYKVGVYRILNTFQQKFYGTVQNIQSARKLGNYRPQYSTDVTILYALHEVNADDCLIAASFFVSNFEMDHKLYSQPKKFNVTIVHRFAEFQNCLRHSMHLNALLGYPYEPTKIASLFNGTLLYNLCSNFKKRDNVETYINSILHSSPSLERLFNILLLKLKPLFNMQTMQTKVSRHKKQRTKYEKKGESAQEDHEEETEKKCESANEPSFHDVNNPFTVLDAMQE